jgi:hypothetical protein
MRKVEFLETVLIGSQTYLEGDVKSFEDDEAGEYIRLGWAKDPVTGEAGDRKPGAQALEVDRLVQKVS